MFTYSKWYLVPSNLKECYLRYSNFNKKKKVTSVNSEVQVHLKNNECPVINSEQI
jgi:hypothetical protein